MVAGLIGVLVQRVAEEAHNQEQEHVKNTLMEFPRVMLIAVPAGELVLNLKIVILNHVIV